MKLLVNASPRRVHTCYEMWPMGVGGQLMTPLLRSVWAPPFPFAIDNGCYARFLESRFVNLLARNLANAHACLFVSVPDVVGDHKATLARWHDTHHLVDGYVKAFVAQDGYDGLPPGAQALFVGGTDEFKESSAAVDAVIDAKHRGLHVHVGRVNTTRRFIRFARAGADTCDGTGLVRHERELHLLRERLVHERMPYTRDDWR